MAFLNTFIFNTIVCFLNTMYCRKIKHNRYASSLSITRKLLYITFTIFMSTPLWTNKSNMRSYEFTGSTCKHKCWTVWDPTSDMNYKHPIAAKNVYTILKRTDHWKMALYSCDLQLQNCNTPFILASSLLCISN